MAAAVSLLGIRHHGPGSARRLREALDELAPSTVLIEGPADATPLLGLLADPAMEPPVAMLISREDDPARASFFPFAIHSPEYQAVLWAVEHGAVLRFIDLPASDTQAAAVFEDDPESPIERDPIGVLAQAAGYADGESWWSDVIEENRAPGPVFEAVAEAMTALRAATPTSERDAAREAHMRLEISRAAAEVDGPVAVVCGAWHVPALAEAVPAAADKALLGGRAKTKVRMTWVPWTTPRLARATGYGAGVESPGWSAHLWRVGDSDDRDTQWLVTTAEALRERGRLVSTASVIEAQRLGRALAVLRDRPSPGFAELRDAAISALCFGDVRLWHEISSELLLGSSVGAVPEGVPLAPLLDDLARQQRALRLKPEGLERPLAIDLRTDSGLARSTLLHRLTILDVPWGHPVGAGRSRGTFRENWMLRWDPEFAVRLADHSIHGSTIADAASVVLGEAMVGTTALAPLADLVFDALVADLPATADAGIALIAQRAALTSECRELLAALPPIVDIVRYGEARRTTGDPLSALVPRLAIQAAIALPYAARQLDDEAAAELRTAIATAHAALALVGLDPADQEAWTDALRTVLDDSQGAPAVVGTVARVLYEAGEIDAERLALVLARMLSQGTPIVDAAGFFEGFFTGAGDRLIHDRVLRDTVDAWLVGLPAEDFAAHLPLFRRVFSTLERGQRRRLVEALFDRSAGAEGYREVPGAVARWDAHARRLFELLRTGEAR